MPIRIYPRRDSKALTTDRHFGGLLLSPLNAPSRQEVGTSGGNSKAAAVAAAAATLRPARSLFQFRGFVVAARRTHACTSMFKCSSGGWTGQGVWSGTGRTQKAEGSSCCTDSMYSYTAV